MTSIWIKNIDLSLEIPLEAFQLATEFIHVANVIRSPKGVKRSTVITFEPVITKKEWAAHEQWIYILTIGGKIVKIGGTRTGLKDRTGSYLCGHHTADRGKSGKCSVTNAHVYNTLDNYIELGYVVEMYAYKIPRRTVTLSIWGRDTIVDPQVYTAYETGALKKYSSVTGHYPALSDNCDPTQR